MKKFKNWLKNKLKNFLGISLLEEDFREHRNLFYSTINKDREYVRITKENLLKEISEVDYKTNVLHTTMENVVTIATNVEYREKSGSWAAVCIEGKVNRIQFYRLGATDANDVFRFLKQFEAGKHIIDSPFRFLNDGLFKF